MSSSTTAPQQERSREAAGMEQKQTGTQNECKDVTTGMWQEEGRRNSIRNAEGTSSSSGASEQKQRRPHNRNAAGIQQGCSRNAAKPNGATADTVRGGSTPGTQQGCNRNAAKTTGGAAGTQQERSKNSRSRQGCNRNAAKMTGAAAGIRQSCSRNAARTTRAAADT